ncbi:MAG TPA: ATP-binding protein [Saliniramus sp.]|nr:ATP-binding protein [Saliniramus sp.]
MGTSRDGTVPAHLIRNPAAPAVTGSGASLVADSTRGFRLLWAASILIPLVILMAASLWSARTVENEARARVSRTVDMLHEHALRSLETQEAVLEAVDRRLEGMSWDEIAQSREVHDFLAALDRRSLPSGGIVLVSPDKQLVAGSARFPFARIDASDRDYTDEFAHEPTGTFLGETVTSRPRGTRVFPISRPRTLDDGSSGWIVGSFLPGYFEEFYRSVTEDDRDVVSLVRADGSVLASTYGTVRRELHASRDSFAQTVRASPVAGIISARSEVDGIDRLIAYRVVDGYPLYSVYGLNRSVIRAAWLREVTVYALICGLAAALLLALTLRIQSSVRRERIALAEARQEAERRADAESRLLHAQKVDALGQMVGGVAHDFNNIVQAMKGGAARVTRRADDPDEVRRVAGMIDTTAERGARLIARMLAFARREKTRTEFFDPREALVEIGELLRETIGSGYRVSLAVPEKLPRAKANRSEFETAIVNLVLNARDAMPAGGAVEISASVEQPIGSGADLPQGRFVVVTVADAGSGMDAETLARAGEPFFTTKATDKGTGLGLATVRAFAEQAGGSLTIDSALGEGTTIRLRLPVVEPGTAALDGAVADQA